MHSKEKRLFNFRDDSRDFDFRLVKVQREIARGEVAYQELLLLCNSVNIDIPQFNALAKQYGGQDAVKEALRRSKGRYVHTLPDPFEEV